MQKNRLNSTLNQKNEDLSYLITIIVKIKTELIAKLIIDNK
jgi:hypothetical protein